MANETLQEAPAAPLHATEALLNSLPVQPMSATGSPAAFRDAFSSAEPSEGEVSPASQKILNAMLYVVLASAILATVRIFWTSAKELLATR